MRWERGMGVRRGGCGGGSLVVVSCKARVVDELELVGGWMSEGRGRDRSGFRGERCRTGCRWVGLAAGEVSGCERRERIGYCVWLGLSVVYWKTCVSK